MSYDELVAVLRDHANSAVVRIRWTNGEGSAVVTTAELRVALADGEIDTAEIESLEFLTVH